MHKTIKKLKHLLLEASRLSLHIYQEYNRKEYSLVISGKFNDYVIVKKDWVIKNKEKFKKRYHNIIDQLAKNLHPIYEPKITMIDFDKQKITCLNYKSERVDFSLNNYNINKLGLNSKIV